MSRRLAGWILAAALALIVLATFLVLRAPGDGDASGSAEVDQGSEPAETFEARLFYPGTGGLLVETVVGLPVPSVEMSSAKRKDPRIAAVIERFLQGPPAESTSLAFPEGTAVHSIDRAAGGVVFVSLTLPEGAALNVGSRAELLMVYGLVNTLAYSVADIESVALLWSGVQPATFAGHVDTTRPLAPSRKWVRSESSS